MTATKVNEAKCSSITSARKALGLSTTVFAQYMGVERDTVEKWESFHASPPTMAINFARFMLDCHCNLVETSRLEADMPEVQEPYTPPDASINRPQINDMMDAIGAREQVATKVTRCVACKMIIKVGEEIGYRRIWGGWHINCTVKMVRQKGYSLD